MNLGELSPRNNITSWPALCLPAPKLSLLLWSHQPPHPQASRAAADSLRALPLSETVEMNESVRRPLD
jgi:hypothetical protein